MTMPLIFTGALVIALIAWTIFGRRRLDSAWQQLAEQVGGQYVGGGLFRSGKVQATSGGSTITLDTYSVGAGDSSTQYTRIRAPLQNAGHFEFTVFREGLIGKLDKALGAQDIHIGVPDFDHDFVIQGNDEAKVRTLLAGACIRQLIQEQKSIRLTLKGDLLRFEAQGVIKDLPRLKALFDLFAALLQRLQA